MNVTADHIVILSSLLPGILGAYVFYYLIGQRVSFAPLLLFSIFLSVISSYFGMYTQILDKNFLDLQIYEQDTFSFAREAFFLFLICSTFAILFAVIIKSDYCARFLWYSGLSRYYSGESVWDRFFFEHNKRWISIHFKDGSRVVGWVEWFSTRETPREICLRDAVTRSYDGDGLLVREIEHRGSILLLNSDEMRMIKACGEEVEDDK